MINDLISNYNTVSYPQEKDQPLQIAQSISKSVLNNPHKPLELIEMQEEIRFNCRYIFKPHKLG